MLMLLVFAAGMLIATTVFDVGAFAYFQQISLGAFVKGLDWIQLWRNHLAAMLDEAPYEPIQHARVHGAPTHPSTYLLAGWLALRLGVPVEIEYNRGAVLTQVSLWRPSGELKLVRPLGEELADMVRPKRQVQRVNLPVRTMESMLIEELRSMTADIAYGDVLRNGLELLDIPEFKR